MKKSIVVLAVLLAALMTVSAADIKLVAGVGAGFGINSTSTKGAYAITLKENDLAIGSTCEAYFTEDLGAYAEFGMNVPVSLKNETSSVDLSDSAKSSVAFAVGATYKYNLQKGLDLIGKGGVAVSSIKSSETALGVTTTSKLSIWSLEFSAAGRYELDKKNALAVDGGLKVNVVLGGKATTKIGSADPVKDDVKLSGFGVQPFVAVTKAF